MPRPPDKINGGVEGFARFQCHHRIGNLVKIELYGWGTGPGPGGDEGKWCSIQCTDCGYIEYLL